MIPPVFPVLRAGASRRDDLPPPAGRAAGAAQPAPGPEGGVRVPDDLVRAFETALNELLPARLMPPQTRLIIEVDADTRRFVYKSIDAQSGALVRQWPSDQILGMIKVMRRLSGMTVDGKV